MNPLYNELQGNMPQNPMISQLIEFRKNFTGNPQQMVQSMLNSGKISQAQFNQYAQQANQLYQQFKNIM